VYGILTQADGHIRIYSEPGGGTNLQHHALPATTLAANREAAEATYQRTPRRGDRLVVEDEGRPARGHPADPGPGNGYQVITAASGPEALEVAPQTTRGEIPPARHGTVVMPHMLGKEVAEAGTADQAPRPMVLYMSGYAPACFSASQGQAWNPGVALVEKPFLRGPDLLAKAGKVLNGPLQGIPGPPLEQSGPEHRVAWSVRPPRSPGR